MKHNNFIFIYRKASDQGHPHAAYNLAIGHLKGYKTDLLPGSVCFLLSIFRDLRDSECQLYVP